MRARTDDPATASHHDDPLDLLPLSAVDLQILLVLTEGDLHGYGLMKAVEAQSSGKVRLEVGSLYRVIKRLLDSGLIEEAPHAGDERGGSASGGRGEGTEREAPPESRRGPKPRRFYTISTLGRQVAAAEARRLAEVVETARARALIEGKRA